jgi:hypothetical protein
VPGAKVNRTANQYNASRRAWCRSGVLDVKSHRAVLDFPAAGTPIVVKVLSNELFSKR